jgi:hypothetical protein
VRWGPFAQCWLPTQQHLQARLHPLHPAPPFHCQTYQLTLNCFWRWRRRPRLGLVSWGPGVRAGRFLSMRPSEQWACCQGTIHLPRISIEGEYIICFIGPRQRCNLAWVNMTLRRSCRNFRSPSINGILVLPTSNILNLKLAPAAL